MFPFSYLEKSQSYSSVRDSSERETTPFDLPFSSYRLTSSLLQSREVLSSSPSIHLFPWSNHDYHSNSNSLRCLRNQIGESPSFVPSLLPHFAYNSLSLSLQTCRRGSKSDVSSSLERSSLPTSIVVMTANTDPSSS